MMQFKPTHDVLHFVHMLQTSEPWELVGIDLIGPFKTSPRGHKYAVTATCLFTKWVEAEPIADKSAKSVFYALNRWIHRWGAPRKILTDQGSEFNNQVGWITKFEIIIGLILTSGCTNIELL